MISRSLGGIIIASSISYATVVVHYYLCMFGDFCIKISQVIIPLQDIPMSFI